MQIRIIVGIMILGFAGTLAFHWRDLGEWWSRGAPRALIAQVARVAQVRARAPTGAWRSTAEPASPSPRPDATPAAEESAAAEPQIEAPPPGDPSGMPLPMMVAIHSDGEPELDMVNTSEEPLTVTVLQGDAPKAQFFMPPRAERHVGTDSGLQFEAGWVFTLRSPGYQDLVQTVH